MATLPSDPRDDDPFFGHHYRLHPLGCPQPGDDALVAPVVEYLSPAGLAARSVPEPPPPTRSEQYREQTRAKRRRAV